MANPSQLAAKLQEFKNSLELFDLELREQLSSLNNAWARVDRVWEGEAYQEFAGSWRSIIGCMHEYVHCSRRYEAFLQERIDALNSFESSGGG